MHSHKANWPGAVVFDLDGTLIDSLADIASALNKALALRGFPPFETSVVRRMIGGGIPNLVEKAFLAHGVAPDNLKPVILDFLRIYGENCVIDTALYEGAEDLLTALRGRGVKLGVCTNKQEDVSKAILRQLGVAELFDVVVGEKPDRPRKPDPAPLTLAMAELGVTADDCIMVGDSGADAGCAHAAGVPVILVTFGYSHTPVETLGAQALIHHLGELPEALAKLQDYTRRV